MEPSTEVVEASQTKSSFSHKYNRIIIRREDVKNLNLAATADKEGGGSSAVGCQSDIYLKKETCIIYGSVCYGWEEVVDPLIMFFLVSKI